MSALPPITTKNGEPLKRRRTLEPLPGNRRRPDGAAGAVMPDRRRGRRLQRKRTCRFRPDPRVPHDAAAVLCAFDLLELDGKDPRRTPIEERKRILAKLLIMSHPREGIALNEHYTGDGAIARAAPIVG